MASKSSTRGKEMKSRLNMGYTAVSIEGVRKLHEQLASKVNTKDGICTTETNLVLPS